MAATASTTSSCAEACQLPLEPKVNTVAEEATPSTEANSPEVPTQLQAGLFHDDDEDALPGHDDEAAEMPHQPRPPSTCNSVDDESKAKAAQHCEGSQSATGEKFEKRETFFIFDWDDTVLSSTWVQRQGLRLDAQSKVTPSQREALAEVAAIAARTLQAARQHGTVVLVTNAERGWIELSCQKFLPTLAPMLENVKLVSARTTYENSRCKAPQSWKLHAFEAEITSFYGAAALFDASKRKNIFSLGDSIHEREALLRVTASVPGCHSKSLKFVERPDIKQICKQHELINNAFGQIVDHEGHLDLSIQCP